MKPKALGVAAKIFKQRPSRGVSNGDNIRKVHALEEEYAPGYRMQKPAWTSNAPLGGNRIMDFDRQVPIRAGHPNPQADKMYDIKKKYVDGSLRDPETGGAIGREALGKPIFDESDKQYFAEKEKQAEEIEYESFASSLFNLDDPATAALVSEKILPDFYAKREAEIDKMAKLQARLAKIRMRGGWPKDNEEMMLLYALQKGYLQAPTGAIWDFARWRSENNLQRGIFNPLRSIVGAKPYTRADSAFDGVIAGQRSRSATIPDLPVAGRMPGANSWWL